MLSDDQLARAIAFIDANLAQPIRLQDIAAAAGLSVFHFARMFRASTGHPPMRYVWRRRARCVIRRLKSTREPLAIIALECGFADQAHMTTVFRRETGHTPGACRGLITDR